MNSNVQAYADYLHNLQPGDEILIEGSASTRSISTIKHMTPTGRIITTNNTAFSNKGKILTDSYYPARILFSTLADR